MQFATVSNDSQAAIIDDEGDEELDQFLLTQSENTAALRWRGKWISVFTRCLVLNQINELFNFSPLSLHRAATGGRRGGA